MFVLMGLIQDVFWRFLFLGASLDLSTTMS